MYHRYDLRAPSLRAGSVAALALAGSLALGACAENAITGPGAISTTKCPAASVRGNGDQLHPSGAPRQAVSGGGCDHRARIDLPLDRVIDLNDNAEVLGTQVIAGRSQLVVWSKAGVRVLTPPAGATSVDAYDLNNGGNVVGCSFVSQSIDMSRGARPASLDRRAEAAVLPCQAVLWDAQGNPTVLGTLGIPGVVEARPAAINDAGTIVGETVRADGTHQTFVRFAGGSVVQPIAPGTQSGGVAINEPGTIVGWYSSTGVDGPRRAFSWTSAGGAVDLGTMTSGGASATTSLMPVAIDSAGDVVGNVYSYDTLTVAQTRTSTFLYDPRHGMRDLRALSGIDNVVDVNAQGEILGWATLDGTYRPVTWNEARGSLLAVRYGWSYDATQGYGALHNINSWNEVLDSFNEASTLRNVVWTWDPERYRSG